jgi:hypothetical protein
VLPEGTRLLYAGDEIPLLADSDGGPYALQTGARIGVDAARTNTAEGRWVNAPRGTGLRSNCRFILYRGTAVVETTRRIEPDEELLCGYGSPYWSRFGHQQPAAPPRARVPPAAAAAVNTMAVVAAPPVVDPSPPASLAALTRSASQRRSYAAVASSAPPSLGSSPLPALPPATPAAPQSPPLQVVDPSPSPLAEVIRDAARRDPSYQTLLHSPKEAEAAGLRPRDGLLYHGDRLAIPADPALRTRLLSEAHDPIVSGHTGVRATKKRLQERVYWQGMNNDVHAYVTSCDSCQRFKVEQRRTAGLLQPLPIPQEPGYTLNLDFVTDLPRTTAGHTAYLSMTCSLSSVTQVGFCTKEVTSELAAQLVFDHWARYYGLPVEVVSDRDPRFDRSLFWKALLRLCGIESRMSSAGHAQSDGRSENKQRSLHKVLRQYVDFEQTDWDTQLRAVVLSLNTTHSATTNMTPFEIMLGRKPRLPLDIALDPVKAPPITGLDVPAAQTFLQRIHGAWGRAREALLQAQASQKKFADRHRRELKLKVGDEVLLSTRDLRLIGGQDVERKAKLAARFVGPFPITQVVNDNAYKLALPPSLHIHSVQNVSKLRLYIPSPAAFAGRPVVDSRPPPAAIDPAGSSGDFVVQRILAKRLNHRRTQYLIRWAGYPVEDSSWVDAKDVHAPDLLADFELAQVDAASSG